ncbi:MAG: hypothetical protein V4459_08495 [Pseudomonadota bacterium]
MKLRYGDLLQLLERLHALPRSRAVATESRIKNFSRLGFPNGPRVGSGERADYGVDQIVQLLVAFELLRLRVPPGVIAEIVRTEWATIGAAFATAARTIDDRSGNAARRAKRPLLVVDAAALHEAGKTVRRGELLTSIELLPADEFLGGGIASWRSAMLIDPAAVLADAAALVPGLRRSIDPAEFLAAIASLDGATSKVSGRSASIAEAAADGWAEGGYSRRRALADALAVLRAALPLPEENPPQLSPGTIRRLAAALTADGRPLSHVDVGGRTLEAALAVYLHWIGALGDRSQHKPSPADILVITTAVQTPQLLREAMVDAILGEIGTPVQDI